MPEIFSRHRPLALLAAALLAQVLLLAFQIKRANDVRLIRYWAAEIVTPGERGANWTFSGIGDFWQDYIALRGTHAENIRLREEVDRLQLRNQELQSQAFEAQRLSLLLNFRDEHRETPMVAAQVIGGSADPSSHTLFINRGERARIRLNQPVITPDGIVGKIVEVSPTTAQVLLINDRDSGVGALFADSRTQGIVKGTGDPEPLMAYVTNDEPVHPGDLILTSGEDRIFPKGLMIGRVARVKPGYPFQTIHVQTAARLDRLEDVLVLLTQQELSAGSHETSKRAVDAGTSQSEIVRKLAPERSSSSAAVPSASHTRESAQPIRSAEKASAPPAPIQPPAPKP
jgi:rod shape-determining protein MreC